MKTITSKLVYALLFLVAAGLISCEGDTGPAGSDGADGADGADGNANVTIISLSSGDITWVAGDYLGRTANIFTFTEEAVNQDIIDHGTVLGFCFLSSSWYALPFAWQNVTGTTTQWVFHTYALNTINLSAYQTTGVLNPSAITQYRFLLITDNTVLAKSTDGKNILTRMEDARVDVTNYYEVMDYFGLKY